MKILICDDKKINYFSVPDNAEDYFMINYNYNHTLENITLEEQDNKWFITTNSNIQIYDKGNITEKATIEMYKNYRLHFNDINLDINLYTFPNTEIYYNVSTNDTISVGCAGANITYKATGIEQNQLTITKDKTIYNVKNNIEQATMYINNKKESNHILKIGDTIFINGLKIIWMESFMKINSPNNLVSINGLNILPNNTKETNQYTGLNEFEKNMKLYNDDELFFHTPRLLTNITRERVLIVPPPEKDHSSQTPLLLSIGSTLLFGLTSAVTVIYTIRGLMNNTMSTFDFILQLSMSVLMLLACTLFPLLINRWQKKQQKKAEQRRQTRYKEYLEKKVNLINSIVSKQEEIMHQNNLTLDEIQKRIKIGSASLWSREIIDDDFLTIRLGIGDLNAELEIEAQTEEFSLYDDNLKEEVEKIIKEERLTKNVPITISMVKNKITPFIIDSTFKQNYIDSIMLQILFYYSPLDLKIVVMTNKYNEDKWEYLKYTPHCFSNNKKQRFFATNENEISQVSLYLEQEYDKRLKKGEDETKKSTDGESLYKDYQEYYLIIIDDFKEIKNTPIINRIIKSNLNIGFSIMIIESKINNLPSRVRKFVDIGTNISGIYNRNLSEEGQAKFKPEYINDNSIEEYAKIISNIPLKAPDAETSIPSSVTFLDMYNVGRIDQLNILSRWSENNPIISLNAYVGLKENDKLIGLDLHEKYHGPHGLIAGSTGSGKSEFIITYILSMAINYNPEEVQFVLIDYKGGGLAGAFENKETGIKLPHLVGTITNLDTSEMHRTLVSIKSELKRRQQIFNEARDTLGEGTIDIYKYQRFYREGKVQKPVAHLIVISDEFAELKQQQPEFMAELVSTARIGRSLGVHLILATQKPAGIVDDQIWSNSHFKICLKVQTTEDSMEMLKRPEASEIKETGRFYMQIGNNELFELGQAAWSGAKYIPVNRVTKKIDDSIDFISNDGTVIKKANDKIEIANQAALEEQLPSIVKYLYDLAIKKEIKFNSLWLPNIPADIYLGGLIKKYNFKPTPFEIVAIAGEYDKPEKQYQNLYTINLTNENTVIFGMPGSGKENLLYTIVYSSCINHTPNEVNFYILDYGSETFNMFNKMPHVGDVITPSNNIKVPSLFEHLENEIRKRKELFSEYQGSFETYCKKSGSSVPLIVTIVNGYEGFMENCSNYEDYLIHLLREGSKYGIVFVTSVVSTNSLRSSIQEYYNNKILLRVSDPFDYQYILGAAHGTVPSKLFGRGLTKVLNEVCEFQTANITLKEEINDAVVNTGKELSNAYKMKAPDIKIMPKVVKLENMFRFMKGIDKVPIGYSRDNVELTYYDFTKNKSTIITGNNIIADLTFMGGIIDLIKYINNVKLNIFDLITCINTDGNVSYYNTDFVNGFADVLTNKPAINIILGAGDYLNNLNEQEIAYFRKILENLDKLNQTFIFIDDYNRISKIASDPYFNYVNKQSGIWYGNDIDIQTLFKINKLHTYDVEPNLNDVIYIIENGEYEVIKGIGKEEVSYF